MSVVTSYGQKTSSGELFLPSSVSPLGSKLCVASIFESEKVSSRGCFGEVLGRLLEHLWEMFGAVFGTCLGIFSGVRGSFVGVFLYRQNQYKAYVNAH